MNSIQEGDPLVIFAKKGAAVGSATVFTSTGSDQALQVDETITGRYVSGKMISPIIGPALQWQSLLPEVEISEQPQTDEFSFDVIGRNFSGQETVLKTGLTSVEEDLSDINADSYPYLKIIYHASDSINLTPPQLAKWLVTYTPAAEGVLVFNGALDQQTLNEGESWSESFGFKNISQKEFTDSLTVQYSFFNNTSRTSFPSVKRIKAPLPGAQTDFALGTNSLGKAGFNNFKIFVNPKILPELYYDNNTVELKNYLHVIADKYSPVLDVTVDGRHLKNGDYVSANPEIALSVWDENPLLPMADTTGVKMFLKYPCEQCEFTPIYFKRSDVQWSPATAASNFKMVFKPQHLQAGAYELLAEARDVSGNRSKSGIDSTYHINFIVSNENGITIQKPYPNPSSSVFFFTVVVSGDTLPDVMRLQIIGSSGKEIGEFLKTDFYTGTNSVPWSGTDAAGSPLPGGLYFYRIVLTRAGNEMKTVTGKLMLVRE
jgi:hypothetical protein